MRVEFRCPVNHPNHTHVMVLTWKRPSFYHCLLIASKNLSVLCLIELSTAYEARATVDQSHKEVFHSQNSNLRYNDKFYMLWYHLIGILMHKVVEDEEEILFTIITHRKFSPLPDYVSLIQNISSSHVLTQG